MKQIVFASNNPHKLRELRELAGADMAILSLDDIGCHDDIPETADTFEGNALLKARWVKERYGYDCFADDSGLEVDALGGEPGVRSARYAGEGHDSAANNAKLLVSYQAQPIAAPASAQPLPCSQATTSRGFSTAAWKERFLPKPTVKEVSGMTPCSAPSDGTRHSPKQRLTKKMQ